MLLINLFKKCKKSLPDSNINSAEMAKTIKSRVSHNKPLTMKPLPVYKRPRIDPGICLYEIEYNDNSDSRFEAVIHVKIEKSKPVTNQNLNKITFLVIKYFGHQEPRVVCVLREIAVSVFGQLGITTWKGIDQRWVYYIDGNYPLYITTK